MNGDTYNFGCVSLQVYALVVQGVNNRQTCYGISGVLYLGLL